MPPRTQWAGDRQVLALLESWLPRALVSASSDTPPVGTPPLRLLFRADPDRADLGNEGYELRLEPRGVTAVSGNAAGLVFAAQTLRQLVFAHGAEIPCCRILDKPRFSWRGVHLDSARHFFPVETVLRLIDLASLHKLNRLHWHLTDDQGWRLEIRSRPLLTTVGAAGGRFYSREDVKRVVEHAQAHGITVVPEVDLPGHMQAAIAAYPGLGSAKTRVGPRTTWGISRHVLNPEPSTIQFLEEVLTDVLEQFPGPWIHCGGDEVLTGQWKRNPAVQRRMHELGLKGERALQGWFTTYFARWLAERGRVMMGWDEILESAGGRLPQGTILMSWRHEKHGIKAAQAGFDVVMTPTSHTYFDYPQGAVGTGLKKVYGYEPVPAALEGEAASRILGSQGQLWSERIPDQDTLDRQAFPRLCALSEVTWSAAKARDWVSFTTRLDRHLGLLESLGIRSYRGEPRPTE